MRNGRRDAAPFATATMVGQRRGQGITAAFLCLALVVGANVPSEANAAPAVSRQSYSVTDFDSVRLEAPVDVAIVTGKGVAASGTGDRDTLDALALDVSSRTLIIRMRQSAPLGGSGGRARAPTRLVVTTGDMRRATLSGAGTLTVDRLKAARAEATLRGSGTLTIGRIEADRLDLGVLGAGTLVVSSGSVLEMVAAASGSGRIDTTGLDAQRLRVGAEGSVDVQMKGIREADIAASGSGRVTVIGKAQCSVRKVGNAILSCSGLSY